MFRVLASTGRVLASTGRVLASTGSASGVPVAEPVEAAETICSIEMCDGMVRAGLKPAPAGIKDPVFD